MKKVIILLLCFVLAGCVRVNSSKLFNYPASWLKSFRKVPIKTINKTVGLKILLDKRPKNEIVLTKDMKDFSELITNKLFEHFKEFRVFKEIHFPANFDEDIIIEGTIDRFWGKVKPTMVFSPFDMETYVIVGITLALKDNKSKATIIKLNEFSDHTNYGSWSMRDLTWPLNYAFMETVRKLAYDCLVEIK